MNAILRALSALLYPARAVCLGCGALSGCDEDWLCPSCRGALDAERVPDAKSADLLRVRCAYWYGGIGGTLVRRMKYRGARCLAPLLADAMAAVLDDYCMGSDVIVPAPMHRLRRRFRGFNQAELLARALSLRTGIPVAPLLARRRNTRQQARLSREARAHNLDGAFRAEKGAAGKRILLVDDVYTTGATARECARTLMAAGARGVCLVAACRSGD